MASDELTDNYVASLLAKDAKESSIKYSSVGLEAFARSKQPANKPKPNTRFLRNIIKDTDSHNAALLAKEASESRARLEKLHTNSPQRTERPRVGGDIRRRQLGDIAAILGGRPTKRKRVEKSEGEAREGRRVNTSSDDEPMKEPRGKKSRDHEHTERDEHKRSRSHRSHRRHRTDSKERERDRDSRRDRSRSRSPREYRGNETRPQNRHRSQKRLRSRSPDADNSRDKPHRSHRHLRSPSQERKSSKPEFKKPEKPAYDSDPLDDIIGPRPPTIPEVRRKGRGTISQASGIDSRFSANYDPMADVQLDFDEENDWDQALEALKDRQKWKQQGADRLRAAGFTEEEVSKWERGGEKREADVKWSKKGEGREWDRGKVVNDDGAVTIEAKFGRLTDA
ncbi:related to TSM1-component of TFIID complex [Rhynchosporium graminicola]|uniref:Related to TSM1-component of TFIID complex n=1 Tax=Rhynchosporium graminicola TaxID=2792576 RepID=A0A1E1L284_9HELO|nr:related to TSM1-component of TFIID complex [Rhynchosporium commune]